MPEKSVNSHRKHRRPILSPTNVRRSSTKARCHDSLVPRKEDAGWRAIAYRSMTTTAHPDNRAADTLSPGPRESSCNTSEIRVKYPHQYLYCCRLRSLATYFREFVQTERQPLWWKSCSLPARGLGPSTRRIVGDVRRAGTCVSTSAALNKIGACASPFKRN